MNTYYSGQSHRPAGFLVRSPRPTACTLRRPHWLEAPTGFGLSRFATVFMNNPG